MMDRVRRLVRCFRSFEDMCLDWLAGREHAQKTFGDFRLIGLYRNGTAGEIK